MVYSRYMWLGLLALTTSRRFVLAFSPSRVSSSFRATSSVPYSTTTTLWAQEKAPRHDVRSNMEQVEMDPEEAKIQAAFAEHQQNAPKMSFAQDVRTLVQYNHGFAVMSTNSKS